MLAMDDTFLAQMMADMADATPKRNTEASATNLIRHEVSCDEAETHQPGMAEQLDSSAVVRGVQEERKLILNFNNRCRS